MATMRGAESSHVRLFADSRYQIQSTFPGLGRGTTLLYFHDAWVGHRPMPIIFGLGLCAQQGVSLAGESPAAPSQGGCVDKRPGITRRPRVARCEEGRVSIARWNPKGLRRTSGP